MTRDDDFIGLLERYLDEYDGTTPLPRVVRDAVRARIPSTMQRPAWWPERRLPEMNNTTKLALGAVAVVVAALLGITFLVPGGPSIGGPGETPAPTPTALRPSVGDAQLEPGTYIAHPLASNPLLAVTFTVPDGWYAFDDSTLVPLGEDSFEGPDGAVLAFLEISGVYSDPCESLGDPDVDAGATAEDLADAFSAQSAYEASVTDLTLDGYSGKQVELQLPSEFDASCPRDEYFVFDGGPYPQGPDNRWHLTILDVEGSRLVIFTHDFPGTPASRQADLQSMIASIEIEIED